MARKTLERTIDGMAFTIGQLPAMRAVAVFNRLVSIAGPVVEKVFAGTGVASLKLDLMSLDVGKAAGAVGQLFSSLPQPEFEKLVKELLATATVQEGDGFTDLGKPGAIDRLFTGQITTLFKVLAAAIEVNFDDFRDALGELRGRSKIPSAPSSSDSPQKS